MPGLAAAVGADLEGAETHLVGWQVPFGVGGPHSTFMEWRGERKGEEGGGEEGMRPCFHEHRCCERWGIAGGNALGRVAFFCRPPQR